MLIKKNGICGKEGFQKFIYYEKTETLTLKNVYSGANTTISVEGLGYEFDRYVISEIKCTIGGSSWTNDDEITTSGLSSYQWEFDDTSTKRIIINMRRDDEVENKYVATVEFQTDEEFEESQTVTIKITWKWTTYNTTSPIEIDDSEVIALEGNIKYTEKISIGENSSYKSSKNCLAWIETIYWQNETYSYEFRTIKIDEEFSTGSRMTKNIYVYLTFQNPS